MQALTTFLKAIHSVRHEQVSLSTGKFDSNMHREVPKHSMTCEYKLRLHYIYTKSG